MRLYADAPGRQARQVLGDLLVLLWMLAWLRLGAAVRDATAVLAAPGRELRDAGTGLAGRLRDAGAAVGELPLVGEDVRAPLDGAGAAADRIAAAGADQAQAVEALAFWLGTAVAAVPILLVLAVHLPLRWRFVRDAAAARRYLDRTGDPDLFALRALARRPLRQLARVSPDPARAWRRGEEPVVRELARLELRALGLRPPE